MKQTFALGAISALVLLLCGSAHAAHWTSRSGCASSIGSFGGETWIVGCGSAANRAIYRYNVNSASWEQQPNSATSITVSGDGIPWVLRADGSIWKWTGASFTQPNGIGNYQGGPSCARAIAVGFGDDAWITSCTAGANTAIVHWNGSAWVLPPQGGVAKYLGMSYTHAGTVATPWVTQTSIERSGYIYKWTPGGWVSEGAGGSSITDRAVVAQNAYWFWLGDPWNQWSYYVAAPAGRYFKEIAAGWAIMTDGSIWQLDPFPIIP